MIRKIASIRWILIGTLLSGAYPVLAQDAFLPTWKLLDPESKEQFVAGYLQGWKDAAQVTDVVKEYVKENPQKAVEGLDKIKQLYDMNAVRPAQIVLLVDEFYKKPENSSAGLSKAVSSAKQQIVR